MRQVSVLVVDDDDVDREKLRRLLGKTDLSLRVTEAASTTEAVSAAEAQPYDCVFLDYRLGRSLGTDLVPLLKRAQRGPCAIIMVTGYGDERVAVEAMRTGVYDYLGKADLSSRQLANAIEGSLRWAALENDLAEAHARLVKLSMFDGLTGLPNRNLYFDRLEQACLGAGRGGAHFAVLMIDLNGFKAINDTFGHQQGDQLLAEIGRRLHALARKSDTYARIGGDEFAALLLGTDNLAGAAVVAEKLAAALRVPIDVDGHLVTLGASIGVALYPEHGETASKLLSSADRAMYQAKRRGPRAQSFATAGKAPETRESLLASLLPEAVERGQLYLHYQPLVRLDDFALVGVEALVRWRSPQFGVVPPGEFIPPAEASPVIKPMTFQILGLALDQARSWQAEGRRIPVSVNLSVRLFDDEELHERVVSELRARKLDPELLTLEITETALIASPNRTRETIHRLRQAGIGISVDDFGTGYTSLKYLREFDISEIKIDRIFIGGLTAAGRDCSIVRSVAALSSGFGIPLVAEGIEDRGLCGLLRELGCTVGQGFGISPPLPAEELSDWLDERAPTMLLHAVS